MKALKLLAIAPIFALVGCVKTIETDPATVTVLVDKPYILGSGGVRDTPQQTGRSWYVWSTEGYDFPSSPFSMAENFDDVSTSNNNFIDYNSSLMLQIKNPVQLFKNFGKEWYTNSLQKPYQKIVRDTVRNYSFESVMVNISTQKEIDSRIQTALKAYIVERKIPVEVIDVNLGKATPNKQVLEEMNRTAAETQRFKTLEQSVLAEQKRAESEEKRAIADNAYQNKMGLNNEDFVKLKYIESMSEACSKGANCIIGTVPNIVVK